MRLAVAGNDLNPPSAFGDECEFWVTVEGECLNVWRRRWAWSAAALSMR